MAALAGDDAATPAPAHDTSTLPSTDQMVAFAKAMTGLGETTNSYVLNAMCMINVCTQCLMYIERWSVDHIPVVFKHIRTILCNARMIHRVVLQQRYTVAERFLGTTYPTDTIDMAAVLRVLQGLRVFEAHVRPLFIDRTAELRTYDLAIWAFELWTVFYS